MGLENIYIYIYITMGRPDPMQGDLDLAWICTRLGRPMVIFSRPTRTNECTLLNNVMSSCILLSYFVVAIPWKKKKHEFASTPPYTGRKLAHSSHPLRVWPNVATSDEKNAYYVNHVGCQPKVFGRIFWDNWQQKPYAWQAKMIHLCILSPWVATDGRNSTSSSF